MAEISQVSEMKTSTSPRPRTPNRLRKRLTKENTNSSSPIGVKVKRISEFENYSSSSRGTLGGFLPLCDMESPDSDGCRVDKEKNGEKECVLTQFTKKIGLGIYTRARDVATEKGNGGGYPDLDEGERETWYMFYPPPPSPSLALEHSDLESNSSPGTDTSLVQPSVPNLASKPNLEVKDQSRLSSFAKDSLYTSSNPSSPIKEQTKRGNVEEDMDIEALIHSAENLAEQYQDLLLPRNPSTRLNGSNPYFDNFQSPLNLPSHLTFSTPVLTSKTIRKVKRQHSLRKLVEDTKLSLSPYMTPSPSPPLAIRSPSFLSSTIYPAPLRPTKLTLAAHPTRSPTPTQNAGRKSRSKNKKQSNLSQPPEPPPRSSSHNRARGTKKSSKTRAGYAEEVGRGFGPGLEPRSVEKVGERALGQIQGGGRKRETRRYGRVERADDGVIDGGEGWV